MAITPYDNASWSTYTPLTSQEILAPAMMMRERHDKLDEEYAAINDELQAIEFIAENENDPEIKNRYSNFMDNLEESRDQLMNEGLTSSSRRNMLDLRSRFQSEIQPLKMGYELRNRDVETYNQMVAKDPTYIGQNPAERSVGHYINNGLTPEPPVGVSGDWVTKAVAEKLAPYSKKLSHSELRKLAGSTVGPDGVDDFMEYFQRYGYMPGDPGHSKLVELVGSNVIASIGADSWADDTQMNRIWENVQRAATATMGADNAQIVNNPWARQQAANNATSTDNPFTRPNLDLGIKTTETSDIDLGNIDYVPETGEFTNPQITQWKKEIEDLRETEEKSQYNINNPSVEGMTSSKKQVNTDAQKRFLESMDYISKQIKGQQNKLNNLDIKINSEGANTGDSEERGKIIDEIKRLEKNYEVQKANFDGTLADLEHRNEARRSIEHREKKIEKEQKKWNDFADKYQYLHKDPLTAMRLGKALEDSHSKRSVKFVAFSDKGKDFLNKVLGEAMVSVNQLGDKDYGLFEVDKKLKRSEKSIDIAAMEKIQKDGNASIGTSEEGIMLTYKGKVYKVQTSDSAIEAANQIYPKLNKFLRNYRSDSGSKPFTLNTSTQEKLDNAYILSHMNEGETIVDLPNITIRGINFIDGDGVFYKKIVIDTKDGYPISGITHIDDEISSGGMSSKIMGMIDNLIIDGTLRGTAKTVVKDRPLN